MVLPFAPLTDDWALPEDDEEGERILALPHEDEPTWIQMLEWRDHLDSEWSAANADGASYDDQVQIEEDLYFQRFSVSAPSPEYTIRDGSAPADVDAAVDVLTPARIAVKVIPRARSKKYKEQADHLALACHAILQMWREPEDQIRKVITDQVMRRIGVARVVVDDRLWPELPENLRDIDGDPIPDDDSAENHRREELEEWVAHHRSEFPITLELRNPRMVRWRAYKGRMLVVVEDYRTSVLECREAYQHYPLARDILQGRDPTEEIHVSDVWYRDWRAIFLDEQPIFEGSEANPGVVEHGYREIPYAVCPFRETTFDDPGSKYRGLLTNAAGLYPAMSRVLTAENYMLHILGYRTYFGHTLDGRPIKMIPGYVIDLDREKGEYIDMLRGEIIPPELLQFESVLDALTQRNSVSQAPRGSEHTRSAQQLYALDAVSQRKTGAARGAIVLFLNRILGLALMEIEENLQAPITLPLDRKTPDGDDLGMVTIKPKDIDGYWNGVRVSLGRQLDPAMLEAAKTLEAFALNNVISLETLYEQIPELVPDIALEQERLIRQSVERLPFNAEFAALKQWAEWYGDDSEEYKLLRAKIMQSEMQGGGGGGGNAPQPGAPGMPSGGHMQPPGARGAGGGQIGSQLAQGSTPHPAVRQSGRSGGARAPKR